MDIKIIGIWLAAIAAALGIIWKFRDIFSWLRRLEYLHVSMLSLILHTIFSGPIGEPVVGGLHHRYYRKAARRRIRGGFGFQDRARHGKRCAKIVLNV